MMRDATRWIVLSLSLSLGCSDPAPSTPSDAGALDAGPMNPPPDVPPGPPRMECNPVGFPEACMLPFPSAYYQGATLELPRAALPVSLGRLSHGGARTPLDPAAWNRLDGFSPSSPLLAYFRERIDPASLVSHTDLARSVTPMASTALVDMTTGERVAHFAEVDATAVDGEQQALILRPVQRLKPGHRYAVAVTRAVRTLAGAVPTSPPGFRAVLDGATASDPRLARVAPRYADILAALARAGIQRGDLVLAWDYTTASERFLTQPVLAMRDRAMAMVGMRGAGFTVARVEDNFNARILRRVTGTVQVPLFLTSTTSEEGRIARDMDGAPRIMGMHDVPFVAMIPRSAATRGPLPMVLFGHGLFGTASSELGGASDANSHVQRVADEQGYVVVATDWTGLSQPDNVTAGLALSDLSYLPAITDRLQQALVNAMVLFRTGRAQFGEHMAFRVGDRSALDGARAYYYGISLGGIMGTSFLGYSPDCERGVMNVAGGHWSLLLQRSSNFRAFEFAFRDYEGRIDRQVLLGLAQSLFDTTDPVNVTPHLLRDRLPGTPEKRVLIQMAIGDAQVNNLASESVVRSAGNLPMLQPSPRAPFGIAAMSGPLDSALTVWDQRVMPLPPGTNAPAMPNATHGGARDIPALREQVRRFLQPTGRVEHTCDGPCDPE